MSSTAYLATTPPASGAPPGTGNRWLTLAVLSVSLLLVGLDTTVLNVALPTLVSELGASTSQLQWIVDSYLLMSGSLVLFCGSLADRLGRKWVFLTGLALFTAASGAAAYAGSVTALIVARGAMGVGEALIMPATLAIIGHVFPRGAERTKAIGIWSAAVGVGTVIGPMVGGWLLSDFWWGSVFLINLPIGLAGLAAATFLVPNSRAREPRRLDWTGALLSVAAVASVLWAVIEGPDRGWTSPAVLSAFAAGAVLLGAFLASQRRSTAPMLPLRIFRHRALAVGDALILAGAFALIGTLFVVVQYLQCVLGYNAGQTGLRLGPAALALLVTGPLAGLLVPRIGLRTVSAAGLALLLASAAVLATTGAGDGYGRVLTAMLLLGAGAGFVITSTSDAIVGSLPEADLGVGSATNTAALQLGAAAGVAVSGSLLSDRFRSDLAASPHSHALPPDMLASAEESLGAALTVARHLPGDAGAAFADAARRAFVDGLGPSMATGVGITAAGIVVALVFAPSRTASASASRQGLVMTHSATGAHHAPERHQAPADPRRWAALALICVAQFMLILDVTVVNVALPDMAADLALDRATLTWAVTAYTLCFGGLMLLGGRLADALGARRTLLAGLTVFTAASLVTGLAENAPMLLGGRIAQGVGAALLSPAALSIVTTTFHGTERNKALGVWAAIGGSGAAAGVLIGGALTEGLGWQWVFYVNVPVGLAVLGTLPALVPARAPQPARLDLPGALLVTAGTGSLIYGLVEAGDAGWGGGATLLPLFAAVVLYAGFAVVERASRTPLMDLRMFTRRPVLAGAFLMLMATALLIAYFFLGSVYLQHLRGFSPLKTGLLFLPVAVATGLGAHLASRLVGRIGSRAVAVAGMAIAAAGSVPLTRLSADGSVYAGLLPGFVVASLGLGAVFVTATTTALGMVDHHEAGLASGVVNTFHEVGGSIGVAVVSTVATSGIDSGAVGGFTDAFTVCAIAAATSAVVALGLVPRGKPQMTGGPHVH